uniref:Zinc finger protein n=1 Tax=Rhabditophanes sp. KR3021 TaxID=114890 RepID=A0AC35U451_9BILA
MYSRTNFSAINTMIDNYGTAESSNMKNEYGSEYMEGGEGEYYSGATETIAKTVHQCTDCQKVFVSYKGLQQHSVIHTDEKPFTCDICQKAFRFKSNLFEHRSVHSGFTPHTCPYCGKTCRLKGNLKKHLKTHVASKAELEEAWKPFSSNRRPAQDIPFNAIIVKSTAETAYYATPKSSRKKKNGNNGDSKNWTDKIVKGELVPPTINPERETKLTTLVNNNLNKHVSVSALMDAAKYTSFEDYNCPMCNSCFPSRQECLDHMDESHDINSHHNSSRYCHKCVRLFTSNELYKAHTNAHAKIQNLLKSEHFDVHEPSILEPSFGSMTINDDQGFIYSAKSWNQIE